MSIIHNCSVPVFGGKTFSIPVGAGTSFIIVGANGSGKTRLGVLLENQIPHNMVQRISAQKSLALRDDLSIISFDRAEKSLRYGYADGVPSNRMPNRWGNKPAIHFLNDFDALQQALFSEHNRIASKHLAAHKLDPNAEIPVTKLERLKGVWENLLPHRVLEIFEAAIQVVPTGAGPQARYPGSELSDGERAIFYFLGQCLMAPEKSVIIVDEPEIHVHKAILRPMWDAIERQRPDCGFIYITHDLDFAVGRPASAKYFIKAYQHLPSQWDLSELPEDSGLPDSVVAELVGSRKPILFVEGERGSLDLKIYACNYINFTLIPIGSCEHVIHAVGTYKSSPTLHWLVVRGLIDADDRDSSELQFLQARFIYSLPVAEVENLFALPNIFLALAEALMCQDATSSFEKLKQAVLTEAAANIEMVSSRYTARQIDRRLKMIDVEAKDVETLKTSYQNKLSAIDPTEIFEKFKLRLQSFIDAKDLIGVLGMYDSKGVLSLVANVLGLKNQKILLEKTSRLLGESEGRGLRDELAKTLPAIPL
jgi:energy-coupling factor transporter ATP-binding protein EcfA2